MSSELGLPEKVRACLFDLDGVLTDTASVHTKAWKEMFDAFLSQRAERTGEEFVPFDPESDYREYVDGKKREDGVRSFLESRNIELPEGDPDDPGDKETINGLGTRKNDMFQKVLHDDGVKVFEGSRRYLEAVSAAGLGIAVVSSSANTRDVLELTGLDRLVAAPGGRRDAARGEHRRQTRAGLLPARCGIARRRTRCRGSVRGRVIRRAGRSSR